MRRSLGVAALLLSTLLAGCSSGSDAPAERSGSPEGPDPSATTSAEPDPPALELAWTKRLRLVSEPVEADGVLVAYVSEGQMLSVVGLDPETGKQVWREAASPSLTGMVEPSLAVTKVGGRDAVAILERDFGEENHANLSLMNPKNGEKLTSVTGRMFRSYPARCAASSGICVYGLPAGAQNGESVLYRLAPGGSRIRSLSGRELRLERAHFVSDRIAVMDEEKPPQVARVTARGRVDWRVPVRRLFGPGHDYHYGTSYAEGGGVGWMAMGTSERSIDIDSGERTAELGAVTMVGLSPADGKRLWRRSGYTACWSEAMYTEELDRVPVRCRHQGTVRWLGEDRYRFRGVRIALEGFDPRSGARTWRTNLGRLPGDVNGRLFRAAAVGGSEGLWEKQGGSVIVDVTSGETRRPTGRDRFLCSEPQTWRFNEFTISDGQRDNEHVGDAGRYACDRAFRPRPDREIPVEAVASVGVEVGPVTVIHTRNRLLAYASGPASSTTE